MIPRQALIARLFPDGIPKLWCPNLTHVSAARMPDPMRIRKHLQTISPYVKGLLVPGSTGEGWIMTDDEAINVLAVNLEVARELGLKILVGVLKTTIPEMKVCIQRVQDMVSRDEERSATEIVGFTVCPPSGEDKTQTEIEDGLSEILDLNLPIALYQLPQVTKNEMSPEVVKRLADRYPNFFLFKDTSGHDRVAQSGLDLGGVFMVRGAEGDYSRWPKSHGGPYDGFLLATANCFAWYLSPLALGGRGAGGEGDSEKITKIIQSMFAIVADFPAGNPFANANKILDHVMAFSERAEEFPPPMLFDGTYLPKKWISHAIALLKEHGLFPESGYV